MNAMDPGLPRPRPAPSGKDLFPRMPLILIGTVLLASLVGVGIVRWSGTEIREPDAAAVHTRLLRFEDGEYGAITVIDHVSGRKVEELRGELGFLRGALRALARERIRAGGTPKEPFEIIARADGRLTLLDPSTGQRLDLESFGPDNAAVFARLLKE
jgi:putative photosynthetic complex assembly protein